MKKGTNKPITEEELESGDAMVLESGKNVRVNTKNEYGTIDLTDEGRAETSLKIKNNMEKPWRGMKHFPEYGVFAINEKNAKRKQKITND